MASLAWWLWRVVQRFLQQGYSPSRLLTFPNVLITGHQAFFAHCAMTQIAETTLSNVDAFAAGSPSGNEVQPEADRG